MLKEIREANGLYLPTVKALQEAASDFVHQKQRIGAATTKFAMIEESELDKIITNNRRNAARRKYTPFRLEFLEDGYMGVDNLNLVESSSLDCYVVGEMETYPELFRTDNNDVDKPVEFLNFNYGFGVDLNGNILATHRDLLPRRNISDIDSIPDSLAILWEIQDGRIQSLTEQLQTT